MRTPLLAGNWKMYKTPAEAKSLIRDLSKLIGDVRDREIMVAPPAPSLAAAAEALVGTNIRLGAQNMHAKPEGAYTGEYSLRMLVEIGCQYVILGHSERRQYFHETNEVIREKIITAVEGFITPIFCIGEVLAERKSGKTLEVLKKQVQEGLPNLSPDQLHGIIIAYEPVWAIGTGETATPEQAEEAHIFVRDLLSQRLGEKIAQGIRILYGGSVKPDNIDALMAKPNIDGALVGGASLQADSFARIVRFSYNPAPV